MFSLWVNIITGVLAAAGGGKLKRHIQLTLKTCCYRFTRRLTNPTYSYLPLFLPPGSINPFNLHFLLAAKWNQINKYFGAKKYWECFVISFCIRVNKGENKLHANTQIISLKMFNSRTAGKLGMTARRRHERGRGRGCRQSAAREGRRGGAVFVKWRCSVSDYASLMAAQLIRANRLWTLFMTSARAGGFAGGWQGVGQRSPVRRSKEKIH